MKQFKKRHTIILFLITIIVLYVVLKDDFNSIIKAFQSIDIKYIGLALIFYIFSVGIKGYTNYLIINDKKKISIKEAIKHNWIVQLFNGITPFATGGEPMEIYMLTEHDIPVAKATNYAIQAFVFYQSALVIYGVLAVTYNYFFKIFPRVKFLANLVLLGFGINIIVIILLFILSNSRRVSNKLGRIFLKVCYKFKIKIKEENVYQKIEDYQNGMIEIKKRKGLMVKGIILNIISLSCLYITPLFVLYSLGDFSHLGVLETLTSSAYVYVIGAFVPIPGASGGIEYGFTQFYGNFIGKTKMGAVLLLWRFITFHLGIIIGGLLFSLEKKVKE